MNSDLKVICQLTMAVETVSSYFCLTVTSSLTAFGSEKRFQSSVTIGELKASRLLKSYTSTTCTDLGDGARRLFGVALALANSQGGFLLIDEAENGIHHSVQHSFWRMVLETAEANNVQVLATTHSWDCVRSFAQAATALDAEGMLVRIERDEDKIRAVEYPEEGLRIVAGQGIEVR